MIKNIFFGLLILLLQIRPSSAYCQQDHIFAEQIFTGKVINMDTIHHPEHAEITGKYAALLGAWYKMGCHPNYPRVPDFDTKLKIQISKQYRGKFTNDTLNLLVKANPHATQCDYFRYKIGVEYLFFLQTEALEISYYEPIYYTDVAHYQQDMKGDTLAQKKHVWAMQTLKTMLEAKPKEICKFYDQWGNLYAEGAFANGRADGQWTFYALASDYKTWYKSRSGSYFNGVPVGDWKTYPQLPEIGKWRIVYENTAKDGRVLHYQGDCLRSESNFRNGKLNGKKIIYHFDKCEQISTLYNYLDDLEDGACFSYSTSGKLISKTYFKNGQMHGAHTTYYYESEQVSCVSNFSNGTRDGEFTQYDEKGNVTSKARYKNGVKMED